MAGTAIFWHAVRVMRTEDAVRLLGPIKDDPRLDFIAAARGAFPDSEWFLVGGAVRDLVLGRPGKMDLDLVVRNVGLEELSGVLSRSGDVNYVGRTFGWPRTERAGMSGAYRDFSVQSDPDLPIERDLARRDFAMNAIAYDLVRGAIIDPHGGLADIEAKTVRAVGDPNVRFAEDHSRMLRAVRFACQLGFAIEPATWEALIRRMPHLDDLAEGTGERVVPHETIAKEFVKAMAADPARAVDLLSRSGALLRLIPELAPLSDCAQSPDQHAEGNVWAHTVLATAKLRGPEFAGLFPGETADAETAIAVLLHDVAKPQTAEVRDGRTTFYGHPEHGAVIAATIAERLRLSSAGIDTERLAWLVKNHLFPNLVDLDAVKRTTLARYFLKDLTVGRRLLHLACADGAASLRSDGSTDLGNLRKLLDLLAGMGPIVKMTTLLTGEDVMSMTGMGPGPAVGNMLEQLKEAQLRGQVDDIEHARELIRKLHA